MAVPAQSTALHLSGNLRFLAGGLSTEFLTGAFIKSVAEDEATGVVTFSIQMADGSADTITLDGSVLINVAPDVDPQPTADAASFRDRRLWWDGVTLKRVARTPGHGLAVTWPDYASASYRGEHRDNPPNFEDNQFYYHLGAHNFVYRINGRNVGGTPPGWRGHVANQAAAEALVSANGQLFEWSDNVHVSSGYVAPTDDVYFWESILRGVSDTHALINDEIDDAESDVQGTVSGRGLTRAVNEHSPFTDVEQDILEDLSRLTFPHPTDDWQIRQTYSARDFFENSYSTFLSLGWDADNRLRALSGDGHVGRLGRHNLGRIYDGSERLRAGLISGVHWLFLRDNTVHGGSDIERAPVDGGDSSVEFEIGSLRYFSMFADPDSGTLIGILRRINATDMEVGLLAYDSAAGTIIAEDTITLDLAHINNALSADFATITDIHHESAGGTYQGVAGAILEGDTLYVLLTDIRKTDGHTASVLVGYTLAGTPNNRTLTILAENAVDELPVSDELVSGILPLEADELFLARDTSVYRLSGAEPGVVASDDTITGDGTEDAPIGVASPYPGPVTWPTLGGRPDRPDAQELIDGTSVAEATPSVSDVVALVNNHRLVRSNADPENIGNVAEEGDGAEVSRHNHGHRFPHDNTIEYDETAENFGINIHDVTEHTGHTVRYFTNEDTFTNGGGLSEGQIYSTSGFRKLITKVQLQTSNILEAHFRVRIKTVDADRNITGDLGRSYAVNPGSTNPHSYPFYDADGNVGIVEEGNQRIAILLEGNEAGDTPALRYGAQASDSPGESYPDASDDFQLENDVVYADRDPAIGQHTHSHGSDIRGNIKIFYQLIYGHDDLGSEIEPSDAVPQSDTEDGSAGDSDNYSRANHAHPGTAGGGSASLGGNAAETLFDNRATTETALSVLAGGTDWARTIDWGFSRALVEADDDKDIRHRYQITQGGQVRHFDETFSAATFRLMPEYTAVSGNVLPATGHLVFLGADGRTARSATSLFTRLTIGVRQRTVAGEDALRLLLSSSGNSHVAATNIRGIIELVPRVENLTVSGGGGVEQQQLAGGRTLAERTIVSGGTLLAANAFNFDVTSDGAFVAAGLGFAPVPLADIFDFVATIRVGGRAGFPITLSREQFDYIGEVQESVFGTWPFGGSGGGSWGNVSEIPCAMMFLNHRSEGIVKNELAPQRQQIQWTITGTDLVTAILIFFNYDAADENLVSLRLVAFTDQVVEIEGMHVHYWEDA